MKRPSAPAFAIAALALALPALAADRVIEEIVVTAQKTEQSLQDVPVSVTAIGGEFVRDAGLTDLVDIVQYAPNVQFYESGSLFASFNIRGFATPPLGLGLEPSVGLVVDDVPYGRSTYAQDAVFDLERLEVLRGPQGALFGKNTVAGVMSFTTAEPSFEPDGYAMLGFGSLDERRVEGGVSFPLLKDVLAGRLSFRAHSEDLGVYNTTHREENDVRDVAGRMKLLWEAGENLKFHLTGWGSYQDADGTTAQLARATARSLEVFRALDPRSEANPYDGSASIDTRTFSGRTAYAIAPKAEWTVGDVGRVEDLTLTAIGAWSRISNPYSVDPDFSPIHLGALGSDGPNRYEQMSIEIRAAGTVPPPLGWGGEVDFVGGVFADKTESTIRQLFDVDLNGAIAYLAAGAESEPSDVGPILPGVPQEVLDQLDDLVGSNALPDILTGPAGGVVNLNLIPPALATEHLLSQTARDGYSIAGFFQGTWHLTERWDLTAGARIGFDHQKASIFSQHDGLGIGAALADQEDFATDLELDETDFSPKLAASYHWSDEVTIYAAGARGFKAGGFDNAPLNDDHLQYDAEEGTSAEIGVKSRWLSGALMANATAYYALLEDLQVRNFTGVTFTTANADRASSRGFELDLQWLPPLAGSTVGAALGLSDAQFDRFPDGTPIAGSDADTQDLGGKPLPYTPKISASLYPSIAFPIARAWGIGGVFGVDLLYRSGRFLDSDIDPKTHQSPTAKVNVRLAVVEESGRWSLLFAGRNLSAVEESLLIVDQPLLNGNYVAFPLNDEPTFAVELRYNFG